MTNIATLPQEGQILVNVEDMSLFNNIKRSISMIKGVGKVVVPRRKKLSGYERSLRDLDAGRVSEYDSLDELINEIEG
ncbi:MAG: hypothetical protein IJ835_07515 [Muribaculaceae bacterium]|nr:hypothetical protein [Muribaculaceae bacterium]